MTVYFHCAKDSLVLRYQDAFLMVRGRSLANANRQPWYQTKSPLNSLRKIHLTLHPSISLYPPQLFQHLAIPHTHTLYSPQSFPQSTMMMSPKHSHFILTMPSRHDPTTGAKKNTKTIRPKPKHIPIITPYQPEPSEEGEGEDDRRDSGTGSENESLSRRVSVSVVEGLVGLVGGLGKGKGKKEVKGSKLPVPVRAKGGGGKRGEVRKVNGKGKQKEKEKKMGTGRENGNTGGLKRTSRIPRRSAATNKSLENTPPFVSFTPMHTLGSMLRRTTLKDVLPEEEEREVSGILQDIGSDDENSGVDPSEVHHPPFLLPSLTKRLLTTNSPSLSLQATNPPPKLRPRPPKDSLAKSAAQPSP